MKTWVENGERVMGGNTVDYNREYAKEHRPDILHRRKERYWTDPLYRETILRRTRERRAVGRVPKKRSVAPLQEEATRLIIAPNGDVLTVFNKAAFARMVRVTRVTVDNWNKWGITPIPPDVDELGHFWYRQDYIDRVNKALGEYKLKVRKEVLKKRMEEVFK